MQGIIICLVIGLTLLCLEVFLPGGVLGAIGTCFLVASIVLVYRSYDPIIGHIMASGILILVLVGFLLWLKILPNTPIGRVLTLETQQNSSVVDTENLQYQGKVGMSYTDLRPVGVGVFEGKRLDVIAESGIIEKNRRIEIVDVQGNSLYVREISADPTA
jgi:membrane-bound serine protease (ClpP class)